MSQHVSSGAGIGPLNTQKAKALVSIPIGLTRYHNRVTFFSRRWLQPSRMEREQGRLGLRVAWQELVRDTWHAEYLLGEALRLTGELLPDSSVIDDIPLGGFEHLPEFLSQASRMGYDDDLVDRLRKIGRRANGHPERVFRAATVGELRKWFEHHIDNFSTVIRDVWLPAHEPAMYTKAASCEDVEVSIQGRDCNQTEDPQACKDAGQGFFIALVAVAVVSAIAGIIESIFGDDTDDTARAWVREVSCNDINAVDNAGLTKTLMALVDGNCSTDDEKAILKILRCLPCDRIREILDANIGAHGLMNAFDGLEWDKLMLRLYACGLTDFAAFDDDATRLFINKANCATLNGLTLDQIRQLILNLFDGFTGDDDELAIIKLISCLPCGMIADLLTLPDVTFDDFDSEVHGDEWDQLEPMLLVAQANC